MAAPITKATKSVRLVRSTLGPTSRSADSSATADVGDVSLARSKASPIMKASSTPTPKIVNTAIRLNSVNKSPHSAATPNAEPSASPTTITTHAPSKQRRGRSGL